MFLNNIHRKGGANQKGYWNRQYQNLEFSFKKHESNFANEDRFKNIIFFSLMFTIEMSLNVF